VDGLDIVSCPDACGIGTTLRYNFLYQYSTNGDASPVVSVPCEFHCINDRYAGDCIDDFSATYLTVDDLCQKYCGFVASEWLVGCVETTRGSTVCRRNRYSPLQYTIASGQEFSIASDSGSSMLLEYPNGATSLSLENTNCYIAIGNPLSYFFDLEICNSCTLTYLNLTFVGYYYDCSNLLIGSCAIVNSAGECAYNALEPVPAPTTPPVSSNYLGCISTVVGTTLCRYNTPSPVTLNVVTGQATFGEESFILFECESFASPSLQTCNCYMAIGDPALGWYDESIEFCRRCTISSITTESASAIFDCSNVLVGNCAIVTYGANCISNIPVPTTAVAISAPIPVFNVPPSFLSPPTAQTIAPTPTPAFPPQTLTATVAQEIPIQSGGTTGLKQLMHWCWILVLLVVVHYEM
jgi:hypothetical protein